MMDRDYKELVEKAIEARENAYVPYSAFRVGAAVLTKEGETFSGCNVENASYGATICAERVAFTKAISEGRTEFEALAVVGKSGTYTYPCGICRQFIIEYGRDIKIIVAKSSDEYKVYTIEELLPFGFTKEDF